MPTPTLLIRSRSQPEYQIELAGSVTIGRAFDNSIAIDDSGASRYHAIIEERDNQFWLSDLGSRNGTTVNGQAVTTQCLLQNGDVISIGGAATLEFSCPQEAQPEARATSETVAESPKPSPTPSPASPTTSGFPKALLIAGVAIAAIVVGIVVLLVVIDGSGADAAARIVSPQSGATIENTETIRVDVEGAKNVERIIYLLDGVEFASAEYPPYDVELSPVHIQARFPKLGSGNHILTVTVEDKDGNKTPQPDTVVLAFNLAATTTGEIEPIDPGPIPGGSTLPAGQVDTASLARNLAAQISGKSWYEFDGGFSELIRLRTADYRVNLIDDARRYRREVGNAFSAKGLPAQVGFVMAISQSRFRTVADSGERIGFWQVPRRIALEQGYITADESVVSLSEPKRSAEIAAAYMKELINVFGTDDFMYAIACWGSPISEAAQLRGRLEATDPGGTQRRSFGAVVKLGLVTQQAADRVVRFYAAGIVAENPRSFGLSAEPLSSLY